MDTLTSLRNLSQSSGEEVNVIRPLVQRLEDSPCLVRDFLGPVVHAGDGREAHRQADGVVVGQAVIPPALDVDGDQVRSGKFGWKKNTEMLFEKKLK